MKKYLKWALTLGVAIAVIGGGVVLYMFNMPHRDVQSAKVDFELTVDGIVDEYLKSASTANDKYLQEEGESKILAVSGLVKSIEMDLNGNNVVFLTGRTDEVGVRCTFSESTSKHVSGLVLGEEVIIKGVIRSGAEYDEDLEMYEDVIMAKCDLLK
ncbi:MAG: hypothetical protein COA49_05725 [Bacteroidetes bacterium]|nr:MAG: hypothetical protein COA49_05725 [Bacteroidota bacterium]